MQENQCLGIPIRLDTNQPVQPKTRPRSLKFQIYEEEELYYPYGEGWGIAGLRCGLSVPAVQGK